MSHKPAGTYLQPKGGWTCFHCGENFPQRGRAEEHFGTTPESKTTCIIKSGNEKGLLMRLRKIERMNQGLRMRNDFYLRQIKKLQTK